MDQAQNASDRPTAIYAVFLFVLTLLVYAPTLRFPFLNLDDTSFIVQNQAVHQWSSVPSFFMPGADDLAYRQSRNLANFYRPAVSLWLLLNYKLFGLHPVLWRMSALVLYAFGMWLFWRLAQKFTNDDFIALAAALLFALHPLHVEGVAWLSGACVELLLCVFFFGGFLAYMRWRESQRLAWLGLCGGLILLALLTKETGAALPLLILVHIFLFPDVDRAPGSSRFWPLTATILVPVALYAMLRGLALHSVMVPVTRHSWGDVVRSAPLFFLVYVGHALWPVHLANWYDTHIVYSLTWLDFYLPLAVCIAYVVLIVWAWTRKPLVAFLLLWWAVLLAPAFAGILSFVDNEYTHDRFTFLALAGPCILVAMGLSKLPGPARSLFGFRAASVVTLILLLVSLGSLCAIQVLTWRTDFAMTLHAVEVSPRAVRPLILLANDFQKNNDRDTALTLYRSAANIAPDRWETLFAYGTALANDGYQGDAVRVLSHGLDVAPSKTVFYLILADILSGAGRFDDASRLLERGMSVADQPQLLREKLGQVQALQFHAASQ